MKSGVTMSEIVKFKGRRNGIQLNFAAGTEYAAIEAEIRARLESGSNFFSRATIVYLAPGQLAEADEQRLAKLFRQYGIIFRLEEEQQETFQPKAQDAPVQPAQPVMQTTGPSADNAVQMQNMMVINRTVRGGQEITAPGSVLICGNVNPGAQIIAGGSIDIRGTCRGIVHAGAYGDVNAVVIADHLMPVQIRIANLIAQAPDSIEKPAYAERASIKNGQIIIEPVER